MQCWICHSRFDAFAPYGVPPRLGRCPACAAKPRHRAMVWYLARVIRPRLDPSSVVLEIGPNRAATRDYPCRAVIGRAHYLALDRRPLRHAASLSPPHGFVLGDASRVCLPDEAVDVVLCNNTLPYVADDAGALAEIRRCLKPDGIAMVDVDRGPGTTRRATEHRRDHPELGDDYFHENGDQWVYGEDFPQRVARAGLEPRIHGVFTGASPDFRSEWGLRTGFRFVVGFRSAAGERRFPAPDPALESPPELPSGALA